MSATNIDRRKLNCMAYKENLIKSEVLKDKIGLARSANMLCDEEIKELNQVNASIQEVNHFLQRMEKKNGKQIRSIMYRLFIQRESKQELALEFGVEPIIMDMRIDAFILEDILDETRINRSVSHA